MTWFRVTGDGGLTQAAQLLFGAACRDPCYGCLAFWTRHKDMLDRICDGFKVETFLNIRAFKGGLKIVKAPSFEASRTFGESNLRRISDDWRILRTILRERLRQSLGAMG